MRRKSLLAASCSIVATIFLQTPSAAAWSVGATTAVRSLCMLTPLRATIYKEMRALRVDRVPDISLLHLRWATHMWSIANFYKTGDGIAVRLVEGTAAHTRSVRFLAEAACPAARGAFDRAAGIASVKPYAGHEGTDIILDADNYEFYSSDAMFGPDDPTRSEIDLESVSGTPTARWITDTFEALSRCSQHGS